MDYSEVIIIGGGPSGSSCAWKLKQKGIETIILDKKEFPRKKLCAGWITPKTISDLEIKKDEYPFSILTFKRLINHFYGRRIPVRTRQYSIRRYEFDNWMLNRSRVPVHHHNAKDIRHENGRYIIDDTFACKHLVGAGGTSCRVYKTFFREINPRAQDGLIVALEEEFKYNYKDENCYLWFFENDLSGYSWYVPKGNGFLNAGIGGKFLKLKKSGKNILHQWNYFIEKLEKLSLVNGYKFNPRGSNYYLRQNVKNVQSGNAYIIGDAAGLATLDMGEGIGPAIESGILAANSIITGENYSTSSVTRFSLKNVLFPWWGVTGR